MIRRRPRITEPQKAVIAAAFARGAPDIPALAAALNVAIPTVQHVLRKLRGPAKRGMPAPNAQCMGCRKPFHSVNRVTNRMCQTCRGISVSPYAPDGGQGFGGADETVIVPAHGKRERVVLVRAPDEY